jgi:hypothetical protein
MIKCKTAADLFVELMMIRGVDGRTLFVLEGETDCAALDPHIDERACDTVPGNGKTVVLGAMHLINENSVERVLALVDADLDGVVGGAPPIPNVIRTGLYDLDAEIFFAGAVVERVIASHTDRKLRRSDGATTQAVVDAVTELASSVGLLRLCSDRHGYGLKIRRFPFNEVFRGRGKAPRPECSPRWQLPEPRRVPCRWTT